MFVSLNYMRNSLGCTASRGEKVDADADLPFAGEGRVDREAIERAPQCTAS